VGCGRVRLRRRSGRGLGRVKQRHYTGRGCRHERSSRTRRADSPRTQLHQHHDIRRGLRTRAAARCRVTLNRSLWLWSVAGGVQDALLADGTALEGTDNAVVGLTRLAQLTGNPLCVTLDLASHLRDERALRVLRNLLHQFQSSGTQLIMVDYAEELPQVVAEYATRLASPCPTSRSSSESSLRRCAARIRRARSKFTSAQRLSHDHSAICAADASPGRTHHHGHGAG